MSRITLSGIKAVIEVNESVGLPVNHLLRTVKAIESLPASRFGWKMRHVNHERIIAESDDYGIYVIEKGKAERVTARGPHIDRGYCA